MSTSSDKKEKAEKVSTFIAKEWFGYWIGLISGLLAIVEAIAKIFVSDLKWFDVVFACTCAIALIAFIVKVCKDIEFIKNLIFSDYSKKMLNSDKQHKDVSEKLEKYLKSINAEEDVDYNVLCGTIKDFFDSLWYSDTCRYTISVSIKGFNPSSLDKNIERWEIITLGRSNGYGDSRCENDRKKDIITVEQNSDFLVLLSSKYKDTKFVVADLNDPNFKAKFLEEYGMDYRNSTERYWEKYRSTIVVPIRKQRANDGCFEILGFLCVDTKEPFQDSSSVFDAGSFYLSGFSEVLYSLIKKMINGENSNE